MINAGNTNPGKYIEGITQILKKVKPKKEKETSEKKPQLKDYVGYYNAQPWGSEEYFAAWEDGLAVLELPTDKPGNALSLFEHVEGDTFKRIRKGRELNETITFERNADGQVFRYNIHGNYTYKMKTANEEGSSGK